MNRVLEAVAAERADLLARLEVLDEIERLAGNVFPEPPPPAPAADPEPPAKPKRGAPPRRALPPARRTQAQPPRPVVNLGERREKVRAAVAELEPASFGAISRQTGLGAGAVKTELTHLREAGVVQMVGDRAGARYHLTETLDRQARERNGGKNVDRSGRRSSRCCDDVLNTVRSEPGKWTERRMAEAGAWDREEIADACGRLLEDGQVTLNADGTYQPALAALEAA